MLVYELSGCGFESHCCHLNIRCRTCPFSSKEFLDIQATLRFTLKRGSNIIIGSCRRIVWVYLTILLGWILSHFMPLISFDTPWKHQKTKGGNESKRLILFRHDLFLPNSTVTFWNYQISLICLIYLSLPNLYFCTIRSMIMFLKVLNKVNIRTLIQP